MIYSFEPIIDKECKVLILGSMPGVESLNKNQYYAHPRNSFWKIMFLLFNEEYSDDYSVKKKLLLSNNIGLWDVLKSCDREGSLDSDIKNESVNDFNRLFEEYDIKHVFFNGGKSYDTFRKKVGFVYDNIQFHRLPSTSPAYTISLDKKLKDWNLITDILNEIS